MALCGPGDYYSFAGKLVADDRLSTILTKKTGSSVLIVEFEIEVALSRSEIHFGVWIRQRK